MTTIIYAYLNSRITENCLVRLVPNPTMATPVLCEWICGRVFGESVALTWGR